MNYNNKTLAGALLFIAAAQYIMAILLAQAVYPNYSTSLNYISDLGVWGKPSAIIEDPSAILLSLLALISVYFIHHEFKSRVITASIVLAGSGYLLAGIFPENTFLVHGTPVIHVIGGFTGFVFWSIAAIASYKIIRGPFKYFSVILGVVSLVALALYFGARPSYLGIGAGGMERMIIYPQLIWMIAIGVNFLSSSNKEQEA